MWEEPERSAPRRGARKATVAHRSIQHVLVHVHLGFGTLINKHVCIRPL